MEVVVLDDVACSPSAPSSSGSCGSRASSSPTCDVTPKKAKLEHGPSLTQATGPILLRVTIPSSDQAVSPPCPATSPGTPTRKRKRTESAGGDPEQPGTPTHKRMTPEEREAHRRQKEEEKQRKAEEKKKKEEERERKKKALEEKREIEKAQKEMEKMRKNAEKEERKKAKEEEKRRKEEEKMKKEEDKLKKREEDRIKKEEQKKKKDEEKKKKEEEKKKREEERAKEVEAKQKVVEKQQNIMANWMGKSVAQRSPVKQQPAKDNLFRSLFKGVDIPPHTVRASYLPPPIPGVTRRTALEIESAIARGDEPSTREVVAELRGIGEARKAFEKQRRNQEMARRRTDGTQEDDGLLLLDNLDTVALPRRKRKFLKFHDNNRPAYFGTWLQTSDKVSPRNPFKQDTALLDYDYDSDADWEEELEGESLDQSEGEEEDIDESDEEDDGFMVPDGYLSESEGLDSDEEIDEITPLTAAPEEKAKEKADEIDVDDKEKERRVKWKEKQKSKEKSGKVAKLRPIAVGPAFYTCSEELAPIHSKLFTNFAIKVLIARVEGPIDPEATLPKEKTEAKDAEFPDAVIRDLIRHVHGSTLSTKKLIDAYYDRCMTEMALQRYSFTKIALTKKLRKLAVREKRPGDMRARWYVHESVRQMLNMETECEQLLSTKKQAATPKSTTPKKQTTLSKVANASIDSFVSGPNSVTSPAKPSTPVNFTIVVPSCPSSMDAIAPEGTNSKPNILTPRKRISTGITKGIDASCRLEPPHQASSSGFVDLTS